MVNVIPDLHLTGDSQCFPFYVYNEEGNKRQENITDWALSHFRTCYRDSTITKWDIFYYVYGLLHHPTYRQKYAANLKRELPRIPPASPDSSNPKWGTKETFWAFSRAGKQLAHLHLHYEQQPQYPLPVLTAPGKKFSYRIEKMRLSKTKDSLIYNETLTLTGIPPETFEYWLGNRSALEWVIDQYQVTIDGHRGRRDRLEWLNDYQVKTPRNSGIVNDPNQTEDEGYILRLLGQVVWVSVETVKIVKRLPEWPEEEAPK
jgi:predicted helicase